MVLVATPAWFGRFTGMFLFPNFLLVIAEAALVFAEALLVFAEAVLAFARAVLVFAEAPLVFAEAVLVFAHVVGGSLSGPQVSPNDVAHSTFGHTHNPFSSRVAEGGAKVDASTQWAGTGKAVNTKVPSVVAEHAVWQIFDVGKSLFACLSLMAGFGLVLIRTMLR